MEAIPIALNWGSLGLLAIAVFTVIQGLWIPKILHDKLMEQQRAGYEAIIALYKASDEAKTKEILRLQNRNEEAVQIAMNGALGTNNMIETLRLALANKSGNSSEEERMAK